MDDRLPLEFLRPILDSDGTLINPVGEKPWIELDDTEPIFYRDLKPDTTYRSRRFEYITDAHATPARVRGGLHFVTNPVRHRPAQRDAGRTAQSVSGRHHGGHIIAVSLGGFASGPNLLPQVANFNVSAYSRLEHGWRKALRDGCSVEVDIAMVEDETESAWAPMMIVTYWEDGEEWEITMLNEPHAQ